MNVDLTVIQPTDLDPGYLIVDPTTQKVRIADAVLNDNDLMYTASATVAGEKALMFMPGQFVEYVDPTIQFIYAGVSVTAAQAGQPVKVRRQGLISASFWSWTPDLPVFCAPNGELTQTPPVSGWSRTIGYALEPDTIFLAPEHMIHIGD